MSQTTYIVACITYYIISIIIVIVIFSLINRKQHKKYEQEIINLERDKNLIISSSILSELNKVSSLVNNDKMEEVYEEWQQRFKEIKEVEIPAITELLIKIEDIYNERKYKELEEEISKAELNILYVKTRSNQLLDEIKEITLSEEKNRDSILKLKTKYRELVTLYNKNKNDYKEICAPIELQFENVDKLFNAFEVTMEQNAYEEVGKIVKGLDDLIGNLSILLDEAPSIILLGLNLIPNKMKELSQIESRMINEGYNLDYLNLQYNIEETNKKIQDIFARLKVLNVEDSLLELKTILDYFDSLYSNFDLERQSKNNFEIYQRKILVKANELEKTNNTLYRKLDVIKYSYDLTDEDVKVIEIIKTELTAIKKDYNEIVDAYRNRSFAYSRLCKEMENLNMRLTSTEEKLDYALKSLGGLEEDEQRAHEQLIEIKDILKKAKNKMASYNIPIIPDNYYVELKEATIAIKDMIKEMEKKPISIKTLNIRVDTARDLVLKLYNTANETIKTAIMAEMAIVYGNRYRPVNKIIDSNINISEELYYNGEYKKSLEKTISALKVIEPNIYEKLISSIKGEER